jgi:hypothetical protein
VQITSPLVIYAMTNGSYRQMHMGLVQMFPAVLPLVGVAGVGDDAEGLPSGNRPACPPCVAKMGKIPHSADVVVEEDDVPAK